MGVKEVWAGTDDMAFTGHGRSVAIMFVSALCAFALVFFSGLYTFLAIPMFGDESTSSLQAVLLFTLSLLVLVDMFALWRMVKLSKHWVTTNGYRVILWGYQLLFLAAICWVNYVFIRIIWFYFSRDSA